MRIRNLFICLILICFHFRSVAQVKILFDASKGEAAGNADWVIDANLHNLGIGSAGAIGGSGSKSNAQRIPTPAQPAAGTGSTYCSVSSDL